MLPTDDEPPYTSNVLPTGFASSEGSGSPMAGVTTPGIAEPARPGEPERPGLAPAAGEPRPAEPPRPAGTVTTGFQLSHPTRINNLQVGRVYLRDRGTVTAAGTYCASIKQRI